MFCATCGTRNPDDGRFCASCGNLLHGREGIAAATVPPRAAASSVPVGAHKPPAAGLFANRYELRDVLGKGGMGLVYRALDRELGEEIAIKLLQPQFTKDAHEVERFKREILTARRITHPNVIRIHDYGTSGAGAWGADAPPMRSPTGGGTPTEGGQEFFISMELLAGGTLAERIAKGVALPEAIGIGAAIADGLAAAHAKDVVHRDIKPHNVLFDADGTPKLVDFGIARFATATRATRGFAGTPHYISPEQAKGEEATERSDVYSLGVLLFELFTGRLPFDADSLVALALKHAQEPPPPLRSIRPELPPALESIVLRCLEKQPSARFASPADIAFELRALGFDRLESGVRPPLGTPSSLASGSLDPRRVATVPPASTRRELPTEPAAPEPAQRGLPTGPAATPPPRPAVAAPPAATPPPPVAPYVPPYPRRSGGGAVGATIAISVTILGMCGVLFLFTGISQRLEDAGYLTPPPSATPVAAASLWQPLNMPTPSLGRSSRFDSPLGWSVSIPEGWSTETNDDGSVIFSDEDDESGVLATFVAGGTLESLRMKGAQPLNIESASLTPKGSLVSIAGGRGLAVDYLGTDPDGESLAARGAAVQVNGGLVVLVGFVSRDRHSWIRSEVDRMAATIQSSSP